MGFRRRNSTKGLEGGIPTRLYLEGATPQGIRRNPHKALGD
jgi:hypothetical protein